MANKRRGLGLRRLLLNIGGGKRRAHDEIQENLSSIARRATSLHDGVQPERNGPGSGKRLRKVGPDKEPL